ncbi:16S rRNA (cytosine(1402)-N(4))-methyltransferase RsmH [Shewanella sp. SR43-4]|jgi:16S rRNA (cytosine1402-N4)-methyltransferase|uniref:Ribosomal RNA small subunit methyltransferase H n=5 Tax=Shewanella TaxID=22 RepID=RSMH_SHEFN|nr:MULTISPECIES: 16S rRNA (cytosine(1402)-N(4))-methyltransferase RsmH [Shewanella]Q07WH7.1 RecName: Full=Ribosomal RNA small subunit methyltransferase H; AltName: Full=16S rRNA m(4)C1402 methyltransferase; AltName: Full=rRNA (cytosine-N(4)-)-methyltransferase RsmH [Shewanella frigidimarina NCIMB 400]ABI73637.1 S-adenosyl-methyltransferase MraW [Shewanella frigidimarina NCIMB 400]KVX00543.1 ribosomal RNA small subunit methyltransferase H [Shewanella frigidimarina]MBB1319625.1 16S rRNA (cytosine|tara:strand:+ start:2330 stop:3271 length:942 start_codon:yes stop_codon:yes gene_type:complete
MSQEFAHLSVLLNETVDGLNIQSDGIYIDGTFGRGGHSRHVLSHLGENGRLIAIDRDPQAIEAAKQFADDPRFQIVHGGFGQLAEYVEELGLTGKINGVLLDLGVSSPQLDDAERGFSFLRDGPLDMRMDNSQGQTAAQWIARAEIEDMAWVFKTYGEEKNSRHIARCIAADREKTPFLRTKDLADLIARITKNKERNKHPATRVFQAIRIYINSELEQIDQALEGALAVLAPQGRLSVISFHSLEDRMVKRFIRRHSQGESVPHGLPIMEAELNKSRKLKAVSKALKPSDAELELNPRARSSVLRVAERLDY